jgi:hypothetical protein
MSMFRKAIEEAEKAAQQVGQKIQDPATQDQARRFAGRARRGLTTIVEKIDPGLLADVVIKATALQEKANASLRAKRSPYRISEVVISAAIPPQVSFTIARIDDVEEEITGEVRESSELVQPVAGEEAVVLALDGSAPPVEEMGEPTEG